MTTNKPLSAATVSSPPHRAQPQKAMLNQPTAHVSSLTQQLEKISLDKSRQFSSPKRATSSASKRKSKSEYGNTGSGNDIPQTTQPKPKPKRSPKSNKVNGVKHPSTPSKSTSTPAQLQGQVHPNSVPNNNYAPAVQDLASHYAGPTFHSSPAPSSLPVPSFLASKAKPPTQNGEIESPPNQSTPVKSRGQDQDDSPLALFFKADREEKNRLRSKYSVDNGVFGSPTLRPTSAGGIPDHMNLHSESPVFWNESPHKPNGRFDWKSIYISMLLANAPDHSTSELPFQMDMEYESMRHPRNHLVQRFRATTEPPNEYNPHTPIHFDPHSGKGAQPFARQDPAQHSDLETSTQTLKNLLSINSTPSGSKSSFTARNGPPSPSPIQHNRTRSLAQPLVSKTSPSISKVTPSRRVFSHSGVPPPNTFQSTLSRPIIPPEHEEAVIEEDDHTVKVEKELRKVLNLS
jgi:hypothetical protein